MPKSHDGHMLTSDEIYDMMLTAAKPGFVRIINDMTYWAPEVFNEHLERKVKEMLWECAQAVAKEEPRGSTSTPKS